MRIFNARPRLASLLLTGALLTGGVTQAQQPRPAPTAVARDPNRLFADSTLITRDRISIEVVGHGPDLIFVPGLASSRETWRKTSERLRGRYRLHLVQVAGFAGEPARDNAGGEVLAPTAEAIDAYIVDQNLAPAVLIGHSMGGTIALYLSIHHPDHLKKVLLVDALPFFGVLMGGPSATSASVKPMADAIRAGAGHGPAPDNTKMLAAMVSAPEDQATVIRWGGTSDARAVGGAMADDMMLDMRPDLASIRVPITLIYPDETPTGAPAGVMQGVYTAAFASVPHMKLVQVERSRHFVMLDQPKVFAARLDAFLEP